MAHRDFGGPDLPLQEQPVPSSDPAGSDQHPLAGRTLEGGLRILHRLGSSKQGTLYQARYPNGVEVGLLVLPPEPASGEPSQRELFDRAARIQHPNVAAVFTAGALEDGGFYAVLEQLVGEPLSEALAAGTVFGLKEAIDFALQITSGLQGALRAGCIHGNISPHTIVVAPGSGGQRYQAKLTGFSLHSSNHPRGAAHPEPGPAAAPYASPERLTGRAPDERSEVFSVGAVLHHLLTRMPPNQGQIDSAVPRVARRVLLRACALDPDRRFQTLEALAEALTVAAGAAVANPRRVVARRVRLIGAAVAGMAIVTGVMWLMPRSAGTSASERGLAPVVDRARGLTRPALPQGAPGGSARKASQSGAAGAQSVRNEDSASRSRLATHANGSTAMGVAATSQPARRADAGPSTETAPPTETAPSTGAAPTPVGDELRDSGRTRTDGATVPAQEPLPPPRPAEPPAPTAPEEAEPPRTVEDQDFPEPLGYVGEPASPPPGPDTTAPHAIPTTATPRSRDELRHHQGLRQAIGDLTRLGIAEDVVEVRPGSLIVSLTPAALDVPSAMYNLERLYLAYRAATGHDPDASVALRHGKQLYARFTREGLILATTE